MLGYLDEQFQVMLKILSTNRYVVVNVLLAS
uniref:Uncharacterized protein n=1 Tax=Siphoviridae sp. cthL03 TaxID=2825615 RepID=A0A8S5PF60_9CAUD|nr:MAG TPA: hypothetical protein [Siphoviridae sp. cthL03]